MSKPLLSQALRISLISLGFVFLACIIVVFAVLPRHIRGKAIEVPNVVNMPIAESRSVLSGLQLNPVVDVRRFSNTVPENHIILQSPQAGMKIKIGGKVGLVVSLGRDKVNVPDMIGRKDDEAESLLSDLGLRVGLRTHTYSERSKGVVISHDPPYKSVAARGDPVDLLISDGVYPEMLVMGDLVGIPREESERLIRNSGLIVGEVSFRESPDIEPGLVVSQSPESGSAIRAGDRVDIVISASQKARRQRSRPVVIRHAVTKTIETEDEIHVRIVIEHEDGIERVLDDLFPPGQRIERLTFVVGEARVRIYENDMRTPIKEEIIR
jgi:serine/threonine-protein kinase